MKIFIGLIFLAAAGVRAQDSPPAIGPANLKEPAYKVLYESGFYREAIDYLEEKAKDSADPQWQDYQTYLAYCFILTGESERASKIFRALLTLDSTYTLDSVQTSPKIYDVFVKAATDWRTRWVKRPDSTPSPVRQMADRREPSTWYRTPLYLSPGGAGQFYNRHYKKGTAVAAVQVLALAASVWNYREWRSYYDDDFGWYAGNRDENIKFGSRFRISFGLFAAAYLYGVADAFLTGGSK